MSTSIDASSKVFVQAVNDPLTVSLRTMALNTINLLPKMMQLQLLESWYQMIDLFLGSPDLTHSPNIVPFSIASISSSSPVPINASTVNVKLVHKLTRTCCWWIKLVFKKLYQKLREWTWGSWTKVQFVNHVIKKHTCPISMHKEILIPQVLCCKFLMYIDDNISNILWEYT